MTAASLGRGLIVCLTLASTGCGLLLGRASPATSGDQGTWTRVPNLTMREQNHDHDCGAAALDTVLAYWKVTPPVRKRADMEATSGFTAGQMRDEARRLDLEAFALSGEVADLLFEIDHARPVIVGLVEEVDGRRLSHFVVVAGHDRAADRFIYADPDRGWRTVGRVDLEREWTAAGRPMVVIHPRGA